MILCIGTTPTVQRTMIFDRLAIDEVNRSTAVYEYASGKSVNVGRVARTLGKSALIVGFAGGDRGKFLVQEIDRDGMSAHFVDVAPQTRLCTTIVDSATGHVTELVEESKPVSDFEWTMLSTVIRDMGENAKVIVCSGSLPPGGPVDFYANVVRGRRDATVIVDGRGAVAREAIKIGGFVLKLNREELSATVDRAIDNDVELREAMKAALPAGGAVVVTMGKDGAAAMDRAGFWRVRVPKVKTLSPIGSGDSFAAGMAVAMYDGNSLIDAVKLGAACGAANALTPRAGEVRIEDVEQILAHIQVEGN
jgi:tagatose 6-phosphate kinase